MSPREDGVRSGWPRKATGAFCRSAPAVLFSLSACVPAEAPGPSLGAPVPSYGAATLHGDSINLAELRGKAVLLNFWATWCAPCRHETPFLDSLHVLRSGEGLEVVGVSVDASPARADVESFVRDLGVGYTILLDPQMRGLDRFRVLGLPASFLVDRDGILRWIRFGPVSGTDREFLAALESVLR